MKCVECTDYLKCSKEHDLRMFRRHCKKAKEEKVVTNADRIRAESDEELAGWLIFLRDDWGDYYTPAGFYDEYEEALEETIKWLQQPAKENEP